MLFEAPWNFKGLPGDGFGVFEIPDRAERRRAILDLFHPPLRQLAQDLRERMVQSSWPALHAHLPRLDWPREYQPFCTWLALSTEAQGYQSGPQLNVGVHADHVAVRLGWDTSSDRFGRFEFLARHGEIGREMTRICSETDLQFRVYAAASWPEGSRCVFSSESDLAGSFSEVRRRGVWWEIGRRYGFPEQRQILCSDRFGPEVASVFRALMPLYIRITGPATPDS